MGEEGEGVWSEEDEEDEEDEENEEDDDPKEVFIESLEVLFASSEVME